MFRMKSQLASVSDAQLASEFLNLKFSKFGVFALVINGDQVASLKFVAKNLENARGFVEEFKKLSVQASDILQKFKEVKINPIEKHFYYDSPSESDIKKILSILGPFFSDRLIPDPLFSRPF